MREAWKRETHVRSQSCSSESAVKYLHVGRRKIQISPPPGEQDQLNALPQGQQRQSNPHPMLCPPPPTPAGFTLIGALITNHPISLCLHAVSRTIFLMFNVPPLFSVLCYFDFYRLALPPSLLIFTVYSSC